MDSQSMLDQAPRIPARGGSTRVRRFDGRSRRTADWDGLRKDSQLWFDNADSTIHLYACGSSKRGPSLKVPFEAIEKLGCRYLIQDCLQQPLAPSPTDDGHDARRSSTLSTISELGNATHNIYIPRPSNITREEAFYYHLTTRNVVAYAVGRPVVGEQLSTSLLGLWRRLREWAPSRSLRANFTAYLQSQGYLSFAENAEHALACLKFAEEARFRDVWINAFAHCAGMHERLDLSPEFSGISKTTSALLTRASLEMDLHISRVIKALGGFLEEELGSEVLGLSKPARDHLDHFRSFLHACYVDKFGWYPPPQRKTWDKRPWREMQEDFQRLYDHLVDRDSSCDWTSMRGANGGMCMFQNVNAFDERHGYTPLPHPLALLPNRPSSIRRRSIASQTTLRNLKLGRTNSIPEAKITPYQALAIATNNLVDGKTSPLIQQYQRFEHQKFEAKLDIVEARKVRWLLVYGVLQMLISIMRGPEEVQDAERASYPVCVLIGGCPVPEDNEDDDVYDDEKDSMQTTPKASRQLTDTLDALEGRSSRISIHPDCEAEGVEEFFGSHTISRQESELSLHQVSSSFWNPIPPSRTNSMRNSMQHSVQALQKSLVGSLNKRSSRRFSLPVEPKTKALYCEIVVQDYGNGLNFSDDRLSQSPVDLPTQDDHPPQEVDPLLQFDFDLAAVNGEPVLDDTQLEARPMAFGNQHDSDLIRRDSYLSTSTDEPLDSNRSSYVNDEDSDDTEISSCHDEGSKRDSMNSSSDSAMIFMQHIEPKSLAKGQPCYQPRRQSTSSVMGNSSVNAGCYAPSGLMTPSPLQPHHYRQASGGTITSNASSDYPEDSTQAADIEELDTRGRRQSRAMDSFVYRRNAVSSRFAMR